MESGKKLTPLYPVTELYRKKKGDAILFLFAFPTEEEHCLDPKTFQKVKCPK